MAWLTGWAKRIKLTIDAGDIDANLANFPILVYISASSGINAKDLSCVFDELGSDANRKKIAITTNDGTTQCYTEIERWNHANEKAWLWIKVPSISETVNTDLYLYYDSTHADNTTYVGDTNSTPAENVWNSNFKGVWHLKENPAGEAPQMKDSTPNHYHGTSAGNMTAEDQVAGQIDGALDFDNINDRIDTANFMGGVSQITVQGWVYKRNSTEDERVVAKANTTSLLPGYVFSLGVAALIIRVRLATKQGNPTSHDGGSITVNTLTHLAFTYDGANVRIYKNGVLTGGPFAKTGTVNTGTQVVVIGNNDNVPNDRYCDGVLDEVRLSNIAHPVSWIKACYETGRDHLLDWGNEETSFILQGWMKLKYFTEPPTAGWNKLKFASEPPVLGAWNKLLYEGE